MVGLGRLNKAWRAITREHRRLEVLAGAQRNTKKLVEAMYMSMGLSACEARQVVAEKFRATEPKNKPDTGRK